MEQGDRLPVVVLISGSGSNLQALIDQSQSGLPVDLRAVISNQPEAYGLERARQAGIEARTLDHRDYQGRDSYDAALIELIEQYQPKLVILAGFMRILTPAFVQRFSGRLLNIHPSLLPKYKGLHTHRRALEAGDQIHGASVHFVTEELDGGPVVLQATVPVQDGDDESTLAARVLKKEHVIYPTVVKWLAEKRLTTTDAGEVFMDNQPLHEPIIWYDQQDPPQ